LPRKKFSHRPGCRHGSRRQGVHGCWDLGVGHYRRTAAHVTLAEMERKPRGHIRPETVEIICWRGQALIQAECGIRNRRVAPWAAREGPRPLQHVSEGQAHTV